MRLFLITDMEGCAGVLNSEDWCFPGGRCYETGRMLLTEEVNAAVRGFLEHGFDEVLVADAHGLGGLDLLRLDERVRYQRGFAGPYPLGMTPDFDAVAWVGQHAKAGTPFAHLAHTSSMRVVDQRINNISVGEFGMSVFMGVVMGIQPIFGSGDLAFCKEAAALCPGMVAVSVKEGVIPGSGRECLTEEYRERNTAAIHLHPLEARRRIYESACEAARRFVSAPEAFSVRPLEAPYTIEIDYRTDARSVYDCRRYQHPSDLIAALNQSWEDRPQ